MATTNHFHYNCSPTDTDRTGFFATVNDGAIDWLLPGELVGLFSRKSSVLLALALTLLALGWSYFLGKDPCYSPLLLLFSLLDGLTFLEKLCATLPCSCSSRSWMFLLSWKSSCYSPLLLLFSLLDGFTFLEKLCATLHCSCSSPLLDGFTFLEKLCATLPCSCSSRSWMVLLSWKSSVLLSLALALLALGGLSFLERQKVSSI